MSDFEEHKVGKDREKLISKSTSVLVVIACPQFEDDKRAGLILELAKTYIQSVIKQDANVDVLNLYDQEDGFDPVIRKLNERDGKILEYRIRVEKADLIAIFHHTFFDLPPAILKGFIDRVFIPGFAYRTETDNQSLAPVIPRGLLSTKWLKVFATGEKSYLQTRFLEGNILANFWQRSFAKACGMPANFYYFGQIRSASDVQIQKWHQQVSNSSSLLDNIKFITDLI